MLIYLLAVNAVGFAVMHYDKYLAKNNMWRVPESTLFAVAAVGGSLGSLIGMYTARHKTRHKSFTVGIPLILSAQIAVYFLLK